MNDLNEVLNRAPFVAILRGVLPEEAPAIGHALVCAGIEIIEVPMNSPRPCQSIEAMRGALPKKIVLGAGTVTTKEQCIDIKNAGGSIVVSPHCDPALIEAAISMGLVPFPGIFTPTEAFQAVAAGARFLKVFPAASAGPKFISSLAAVLPPHVQMLAVGGVRHTSLQEWHDAGARGFGVGSAFFCPGWNPHQVQEGAARFVTAWKGLGLR
jgi:2-dehydro-3-deoxyphosphogalactonate aldolase